MKKIINVSIKANNRGKKVFETEQRLIDDENETIATFNRQLVFECPACGQPLEQDHVRTQCPICVGGVCCDFCHEQRLRLGKETFERQVILEKECLRWVESKALDNLPLVGVIRKISMINSLSKLKNLEKKLLGG